MKRKHALGALIGLVVMGLVFLATVFAPSAQAASLFGDRTPTTVSDPDNQSVELGVRFSADVSGTVGAIRFYKSEENTGRHVGSLWSSDGRRLATATFTDETKSGWQTATLSSPVKIAAGADYVASYLAPSGRYSGDQHGFDDSYSEGHLTVPPGGGVYAYGGGGFPTQAWENSNYYVDVSFTPGSVPSASPPAPPTSVGSTPSAAPPSVSAAPSASATAAPSAPQTTPPPSDTKVLSLPRIPWEGGPSYYAQFPKSKAFTDPAVFPIGAWWADFDSDSNVKWDKDHGVNFYVQLNGTEDGSLLAKNDMYWVGDEPLNNMTNDDPNWVGWWLSDETDGRYDPPSTGHAQVQKEIDAQRGPSCPNGTDCRFGYANYTTIVTADYNADQIAADEKYVNMYKGPVSVDGYYYTDPHCHVAKSEYRDYAHNAPSYEDCQTAGGYGNLISTLRLRDAADGKLKPLWGFLENGAPNDQNGIAIQPEQMKAAMMSMIIHEARGIVWFNQSFSGDCRSGNVLRDAEARPKGCNAARVQAMKEINTQVQSLAPVINTQSYAWDFKAGADTMLKVKDGSAYVFAGIGLNQDPGSKTFTLPAGVTGTTVEVVGENRTLPVKNGTFTDSLPKESTYHVYKVSL